MTTTTTTTSPVSSDNDGDLPVVILDWDEIAVSETSDDLLAKLEQAFGTSGIGLVAIRHVPDFVSTKASFLPLAHQLVHLPATYLESEDMVDAASLFNAGWSHGKEKLGDQPDFAKGSFYYNPVTDVPGTPNDRHRYPYSYPANKWPSEERMPEFKQQATRMGMILKEATVHLAKHIDALAASKCADYPSQFLYRQIKDTDKVKARLLYYFPLASLSTSSAAEKEDETKEEAPTSVAEDSWIGWHNDSGFLTALGGDLYVNHTTGKVLENCPDPAAGLYVTDRNQRARRVTLPSDCMAVQIGECTQIVTAGAVRATPHCVRGCSNEVRGCEDVARISLPCFVDTPPYQPLAMPASATRDQVLAAAVNCVKVPPLGPRWTGNDMTFGEFLQKTFQQYYDWKAQA